MSNAEAVNKVAEQLVKRIFDQRHATSGQINYFFKELVDTTNFESSFDRMLKLNETVCLIDDRYNGDMHKAGDSTAQDVNRRVGGLLERTEAILAIEKARRHEYEQIIEETRNELNQRIESCSRNCNSNLESVKESILQEQLELERKYLKFEENLRNK